MIISVIGETDKRPLMYTLIRFCQFLGDTLVVTPNDTYMKLIEDVEAETDEYTMGYFQNTVIVVTELTPDDVGRQVGYNKVEDFDFVIYENELDTSGDLIIYVTEGEMTEWEHSMLEYLDKDDYETLRFNNGKYRIKITDKVLRNCETVEERRSLIDIHPELTKRVIRVLGKELDIPAKTLRKAVENKT